MAEMGRYCKAYPVKDLRAYPGWAPDVHALRPRAGGPGEPAAPRAGVEDDDILYVQEDGTVTDGIFRDEHVVFAPGDSSWREFLATLGFAPPSPEAP